MFPNMESNGDFPVSHQQGGFRIMAHEVLQVLQNRAKVQVSLDKLLVHSVRAPRVSIMEGEHFNLSSRFQTRKWGGQAEHQSNMA